MIQGIDQRMRVLDPMGHLEGPLRTPPGRLGLAEEEAHEGGRRERHDPRAGADPVGVGLSHRGIEQL